MIVVEVCAGAVARKRVHPQVLRLSRDHRIRIVYITISIKHQHDSCYLVFGISFTPPRGFH